MQQHSTKLTEFAVFPVYELTCFCDGSRETKVVICNVMRALFAAGGFHWVTVKGKQATPKEAPILALSPHSSYFDALVVVYLGAPSVVAKGETGTLPFLGSTRL